MRVTEDIYNKFYTKEFIEENKGLPNIWLWDKSILAWVGPLPYRDLDYKNNFVWLSKEMPQFKPYTVDEWIVLNTHENSYAKFALTLLRFPAIQRNAWKEYIEQFKLYCTYNNERCEVINTSRFGTIGIIRVGDENHISLKQVFIYECSDWGKIP